MREVKDLPLMYNLIPVKGKVRTRYGVREEVNDPEWGPTILMDGKPMCRTSGCKYKPPDQEDFDLRKDRDYTSKDLGKWVEERGILNLNLFYPVRHVAMLALDQAVHLLRGTIPVEWDRTGMRRRRRMSPASAKKIHELRWPKRRARWIWYPGYGKSGCGVSHFENGDVGDVVVKLTYPLGLGSKLTIHPYSTLPVEKWNFSDKKRLSVGYILWLIALEYKRIYQNAKKYGVGGHQIDDLVFEGMTLRRNGKLDLWIGS